MGTVIPMERRPSLVALRAIDAVMQEYAHSHGQGSLRLIYMCGNPHYVIGTDETGDDAFGSRVLLVRPRVSGGLSLKKFELPIGVITEVVLLGVDADGRVREHSAGYLEDLVRYGCGRAEAHGCLEHYLNDQRKSKNGECQAPRSSACCLFSSEIVTARLRASFGVVVDKPA